MASKEAVARVDASISKFRAADGLRKDGAGDEPLARWVGQHQREAIRVLVRRQPMGLARRVSAHRGTMNAAKVEEGMRMLDAAARLQQRARALIAEGTSEVPPTETAKPQDEVGRARARKLLRDRGIRLKSDRTVR